MTRKIALSGIFISMALVLSFFEGLIPMSIGVPGVKLGLANIVALTALFVLGPVYAVLIQIGRVILSALLFGNLAGLLYSLSGGLLSILAMVLLYKVKKPLFGIVAISVLGAVFHNIGQITAASLIVQDLRISYYLPILMLFGVAAGIFVGFTCKYLIKGLNGIKSIGLYNPDSISRL
ncbi:MAG: Gx transporter family protein [Clostridiales bacterium]|nr:Gx transporter family protein [Clostridiales bacterium]